MATNPLKYWILTTSFLTLLLAGCKESTIPTLTTSEVTGITSNSAISGGEITDDGGEPVVKRGICWSQFPNPTANTSPIYGGAAFDGSGGIGEFAFPAGNLLGDTQYYLRAFATNSVGTAYGNERIFRTSIPPLAIGSNHEGGIVAYIFQLGDPGYVEGETHGLIMAHGYQSYGCEWGATFTLVGTSFDLGSGQANTNAIVAASSGMTNYAAQICDDFTSGGYSDWYLPSKYELDKVATNPNLTSLLADGHTFWSSSEESMYNNIAFCLYVNNSIATWQATMKNHSYMFVKAFRTF